MITPLEIQIPTANRVGKKRFTIQGRNGTFKYVNGKKKPDSLKPRNRWCVVASVTTKNGRSLVREFVKIRKWKKATDGMVLELLRSDQLRINPVTASVFRRKENGTFAELAPQESSNGYLCVIIYFGGECRKKVAVNRLQIMADIDSEIPDGFDIDHRNKDITDNRLKNLRLLASETNRTTNVLTSDSEVPF